jgi:hypothetical protein
MAFNEGVGARRSSLAWTRMPPLGAPCEGTVSLRSGSRSTAPAGEGKNHHTQYRGSSHHHDDRSSAQVIKADKSVEGDHESLHPSYGTCPTQGSGLSGQAKPGGKGNESQIKECLNPPPSRRRTSIAERPMNIRVGVEQEPQNLTNQSDLQHRFDLARVSHSQCLVARSGPAASFHSQGGAPVNQARRPGR